MTNAERKGRDLFHHCRMENVALGGDGGSAMSYQWDIDGSRNQTWEPQQPDRICRTRSLTLGSPNGNVDGAQRNPVFAGNQAPAGAWHCVKGLPDG
jgi:hypothetical protein